MRVIASIRRHPLRTSVAAAALVAASAFALYWFAPWNLFVDRRVDEALPSIGAPVGEAPVDGSGSEPAGAAEGPTGGEASPPESAPGAAGDAPAEPVTLSTGAFRSLEHETTGTALVVELPDGSRYLRLDGLRTSNGPDLRVIVTDQPLSDDWRVWDDGELVDLGPLKGNLGSSNYRIPKGVDLADIRTAVIWCRRFTVGFGVAPVEVGPAA